MADNNDGIHPSTPSWMIDNRPRRSNRRRYGRRYSGLGSGGGRIRSTATKVSRRREPALFGRPGSEFSPDDGGSEGRGDSSDLSANSRLEGRRGLSPRLASGAGIVDGMDQSAHVRLESWPGLDLTGEFKDTSQPRKKRRHLGRPPRASPRAPSGRMHKAGAPGSGSDAVVFEHDAVENGNSSSSRADVTKGPQNHPIPLSKDNIDGSGGRGGGGAHCHSNSATATISSKSSSLFKENFHPNVTSPGAGKLDANVGTRRLSRLQEARKASVTMSSSSNDHNGAMSVTTRSMARANSKKRSAAASVNSKSTVEWTGSARPEQVQLSSPPNLRSVLSLSSLGSFLSSAGNGAEGETCFSLAQPPPEKLWLLLRGSKTAASMKSFANFKSNSSSCGSESATALKTLSSNYSLYRRSVSHGDDPPLARSNTTPGAESFLSPREVWTTPTPPVGSASSRKRSCADFAGPLPPDGDSESPEGSQRVSQSRNGRPAQFLKSSARGDDDGLGISERFPRTRRDPPQLRTGHTAGEDGDLGDSERSPRTRKGSPQRFAMKHGTGASTALLAGVPTTTGMFSPLSENALACETSLFGSDDDFVEDNNGGVRDRLSSNDDSSISTKSLGEDSTCLSSEDDDSSCRLSEDEDEGDDEATGTQREMTDAEVFEAKPSHDDFKFLARSLQKWSQASHGRSAWMGLNGGCLIAVPPGWTSEHRARFAKWATMAFGFRAGSIGGAGGGTFLRCCDGKGRETSARLRRILNDHKAGRLALSKGGDEGTNEVAAGKERSEKLLHGREKPKEKRPIKLSSTQRSSAMSKKGLPKCSMLPIYDGFVGDPLAYGRKGITPDETKPDKNNIHSSNCSVPIFIRSMTLKPLASNQVKPAVLPRLATKESKGRRSSGGSGELRPPRLSAESAIHESDLLNQIRAGFGNSPSPLPNRILGRFRDRSARALQPAARRLSLGKASFRSSFERPTGGQQQRYLKPFESPHPLTSIVLETPSDRLEFGLETPSKKVEQWGSRPVSGKDWGASACCCDSTTDACSQIFAKSWFTSDYYGNENLSAKYQMLLDAEDESHLFRFMKPNSDNDGDSKDDGDDGASDDGKGGDVEVGSVSSGAKEGQTLLLYRRVSYA